MKGDIGFSMQNTAQNKSKIVKRIPKTETGPKVTCITTSKKQYIISQNLMNKTFTLWKEVIGGYEKIRTTHSPLDLEELIPWDE